MYGKAICMVRRTYMYGISGCMTLTLPIPTFPFVNLISGQITLDNRTTTVLALKAVVVI